jgi:hypothetical protein
VNSDGTRQSIDYAIFLGLAGLTSIKAACAREIVARGRTLARTTPPASIRLSPAGLGLTSAFCGKADERLADGHSRLGRAHALPVHRRNGSSGPRQAAASSRLLDESRGGLRNRVPRAPHTAFTE